MNREILLEITKEHLETGLRGIPVGYCVTSCVHAQKGLFYVDHPISEVANWEAERAIYLLYYGKDPTNEQLETFKKNLQGRSECLDKTLNAIIQLPRQGHPMALFSAAILILGMNELTGNYREDCLNLIAKLPQVAATVINHHAGWRNTIPSSQPELGYVENFAQMIRIPNQDKAFTHIFRVFNILHYDHGGGNLSTFVGKAVASGLEDLYGSISAAMNALAGPRHGRANQESLYFVEKIRSEVGVDATEKEVERVIRDILARGELIYGFGHAVLRIEDPRATVQYHLAKKLYSSHPLVKMAFLIRQAGTKVLKENPKIACPYPNVDAISGSLLMAAGFSYPEYYTVLFGLSRAVGIAIQIVYERCEARRGKGTPIVRPKYLYTHRQSRDF